jgi:hypothetical protein
MADHGIIYEHTSLYKSFIGKPLNEVLSVLRRTGYRKILDFNNGALIASWSSNQNVMVGIENEVCFCVLVTEGRRCAMFSDVGKSTSDHLP